MGHRQEFGVSVGGRRGRIGGLEEEALAGRLEVVDQAILVDVPGGELVPAHDPGQGPSRCGLPLWPGRGSPAARVLLQARPSGEEL